ncbi:MAG: two-component regulator propeller domain-containing protein [bacterium]|nr:two-component regulator propeller domain-containing protein [bacterium]
MIILFLIMAQQWTSFLNPQPIYNIASNGENIWAATNGGILGYKKSTTDSFQQITNTSGLPNNQIVDVAIDRYGNMWFLCANRVVTNGGIIIMSSDMSKKRLFTYMEGLPSYNFSSICIDGDSVWVGTEDNTKIWLYDMKGDPFNASQQGILLKNLYPSNEVKEIKIFEDIVWFGTNSGIGVSNKSLDSFIVCNTDNGLPNDTVYAIEKWNNYMWAGTKKGIARILVDSIRFGDSVLWDIVDTNFKVNDFCAVDTALWMACSQGTYRCELVGDTSCNWVQIAGYDSRALLFDNTLWIGTAWNGIVKYANPIQEYKPEGPASNYFLNMAMDLDGSIWSSHWGAPEWEHNKVSKLYKDGDDWKWKVYSFDVPSVTNILVDKNNNKWITMADWRNQPVCAVARIFPNDSIIYITIDAPGGANFVTGSCLDNNGDLWIASTDGYIRRIRASTNQVDTAFSDPNGYTTWVCPMMRDADGNLWLGSIRPQCLAILKKDGTMQKELINEEFYFFNKEKPGEVWVGSTSGVHQFKNLQNINSNSYTISQLGGVPRDMIIDSTNIWFAISKSTETDIGGIRKLSSTGGFTTYTTQNGLVNDLAKGIELDRINKVLWVGTDNGLSRFVESSTTLIDTSNASEIIVCPNPFMVSKHKEVVFYIDSAGISGGEVRVYTLSGKLLKKIEHINSSKVIWDGKDMMGSKVSSGVYLVSAFNNTAKKKYLTKFAIIK